MERKTIEAQDLDFARHVIEFRPRLDLFEFEGPILRYAKGAWIPDDGAHDVAFINAENVGIVRCLRFELPYRRNIRWSWYTNHWSSHEDRHRGGNAWHYMLATGTKDIDESWNRERESHPNHVAGEAGFRKLSALGMGCINGSQVELKPYCAHIQAGLARVRGSGEIIVPPKRPICVRCSDGARLETELTSIESRIRRLVADSPDRSDALSDVEDMLNRVIEAESD